MEDGTMIDSQTEGTQEVDNTELGTTETTENQTDYWKEDFDTSDVEPVVEAKETDKVDESNQDKTDLEYKTEGLGDLDRPLVIKRKGKLYDLTDMDQIRDLVERGFDSTVKNQELAELRRELEKTKNPDITDSELDNLDTSSQVEDISQKILKSPYVDDFKNVVSVLPEKTVQELRSNPKMLEGLRVDIESGLAQKIMSKAQRYMDLDGMSFIEAYSRGGQELMSKQKDVSQKRSKLVSEPRTSNNIEVKEKDIWDIPDDQFRALMDTERR